MNHFSIKLWHVMKSGFYTTTGNDQLSGWTEKKLQSTSQSQSVIKKRSWSLFGGLLPIWSTTVFWILAKPIDWRSTLSKLMSCTKNIAMPEASIGQQKGSNSYPQQSLTACCTTNAPKVEWIGLQSFALFTMFTYISPTDYYFFKHFNNLLQEKPFHNQQDAENAFQEFIKSWSMDFYATGINKHFSLANMCWL